MNDDKYIVARLKEILIAQNARHERTKGYGNSWGIGEILTLIAAIEASATLGIEVDEILETEAAE